MPQKIIDERLNNIKIWPNFYNTSFATDLEEFNDNPKISNYNYVLCLKKAPDQLVEDFYNGEIGLDQDNYMRRIDASSFVTTDNIVKTIWGEEYPKNDSKFSNYCESTQSESSQAPPPYIPNTAAVRDIFQQYVYEYPNDPDWVQIEGERYHYVPSIYALRKYVSLKVFNTLTNASSDSKKFYKYVGNQHIYDSEDYNSIQYKYILTVGAVQDIIKTSIFPNVEYSNTNQVIPTISAVRNIITTKSGTTDTEYISPDDNNHIPSNHTVNLALNSMSGSYASDAVYYDSGDDLYYINNSYIPSYGQSDPKIFLTAYQMYLLGHNRWW